MDYTNLYDFRAANGIIVPSDSEVLEGIQTKFQEIFGTDIDLSAETPVGRLIEAMSIIVKSSVGVTAQCANQFNVNEATGIFLDALGEIYNLKRTPGTQTRIVIRCYFSSEMVQTIEIPAGSLIMAGAKGETFSIDNPISSDDALTEEESGRKYALGTATALDIGPILAGVGYGATIQTGVLGWTGVVTEALSYVGSNVETDEEYRRRLMKSRATGTGFTSSLQSRFNRMVGVYSSCVLDNNTGTSTVKKGVVIPPHSIYVGIDFIETEDLIKDIAKAISQAKPIGTGMVNAEQGYGTLFTEKVAYGYGSNFEHTVNFYRVVRKPIIVSVNYTNGNYIGLDIQKDMATVISEYMETVGIGGTVDGMMIAAELANKLHVGVGQILVQKSGSSVPYDIKVEMMGFETPFSSAEYMTFSED